MKPEWIIILQMIYNLQSSQVMKTSIVVEPKKNLLSLVKHVFFWAQYTN